MCLSDKCIFCSGPNAAQHNSTQVNLNIHEGAGAQYIHTRTPDTELYITSSFARPFLDSTLRETQRLFFSIKGIDEFI